MGSTFREDCHGQESGDSLELDLDWENCAPIAPLVSRSMICVVCAERASGKTASPAKCPHESGSVDSRVALHDRSAEERQLECSVPGQ